ncbi:MAG: hypothetical protein ACRDNS_34360, partial [Trebonia sp.]
MKAVLTRRRLVPSMVVAVLVALLGVDIWLAVLRNGQASIDNARSAALTAATIEVPQLLSYNYQHLGHDLAVAKADITGSFRGQYVKLLDSIVGPNAKKNKVVTAATVHAAGVV